MSRASDILRERTRVANKTGGAVFNTGEWTAIADLLDACVSEGAGYYRCEVCGGQGLARIWHAPDCALAAAERAITGESKP